MDLILQPARAAVSKPARRTYLNTFLFATTSSILLGLAILAYTLFYSNYIPQIGIEKVLHLQYENDESYPYGLATLDSALVHEQPYDISISLHVPRSPANLAKGNFMLYLALVNQEQKPGGGLFTRADFTAPSDRVVDFYRRPAMLTYTSRLVSLSERLFSLPLYMLGLRRESELLRVPMAERASFKKGSKNLPASLYFEIQAEGVQVYDVRVHFKARFGGLRWLMYHYRITSAIFFVAMFWMAEIIWAGLGWLVLRLAFSSSSKTLGEMEKVKEEADAVVKKEEDETDDPDLSDTPRTFPTYGRQAPLRYEPPKIKDEDSEDYILDETAIQPLPADIADDESEDFGGKGGPTDSGIGTSFSEGGEGVLSRRKSRGGKGGRGFGI